MDKNNSLSISFIHIHACDDITIRKILYHYHDIGNYITIIDITIISHITSSSYPQDVLQYNHRHHPHIDTMTCTYLTFNLNTQKPIELLDCIKIYLYNGPSHQDVSYSSISAMCYLYHC